MFCHIPNWVCPKVWGTKQTMANRNLQPAAVLRVLFPRSCPKGPNVTNCSCCTVSGLQPLCMGQLPASHNANLVLNWSHSQKHVKGDAWRLHLFVAGIPNRSSTLVFVVAQVGPIQVWGPDWTREWSESPTINRSNTRFFSQVERVLDSSRYFVLKITNGDRHRPHAHERGQSEPNNRAEPRLG